MKTIPAASKRLLTAATAAILVTACGSTTGKGHPKANPSAAAVNKAFAEECSDYHVIIKQILQETAAVVTVDDLIRVIQANYFTWIAQLYRTANKTLAPGVPRGHNRAQELALKLIFAAQLIKVVHDDATKSRLSDVEKDWTTVLNVLGAIQHACS